MVFSTVASLASFQGSKTSTCGFNVPMDIITLGKEDYFPAAGRKY